MFQETNRIEYKEKLTSDLELEAVAFLNSEGGDIFLGIRKDGSVAGVSNPDDIQLKIADRLRNNIRPNILGLFDIFVEKRNGKDIIIINLASGTEKPYCIKSKGYSEAGCYIRIGSSSQPMSQEMIDGLLSKRHPLSLANMSSRRQDLEFDQLKLYYGLKKKHLNDNFVQSLDLINQDGKLNMAAFLLADNNNISVRLGKYSGTDKGDLIEREDFKDCCLVTAMKKVIDRFDIENRTQTRKRPMDTRIDIPLVDEEVLHETIINAFAHNDYSRNLDTPIFQIYSDRFEITSFGGLVDGMTLENFYSGTSMPRNREIMRVFKDLNYVEQLGNGIPKIVKKYGREAIMIDGFVIQTTLKFETYMGKPWQDSLQAGEGTPVYKTIDNSIITKTNNKTTNIIISALKQNPAITMDALADIVGLSVAGVRWQIDKLKSLGILRRVGSKKDGYWDIVS
jgi:predicted HTH transcriptional regulator